VAGTTDGYARVSIGCVTVAYLMLYGNGWTQRWAIAQGTEDHIGTQIAQIGTPATGQLTVVDPGSDSEVTLWVAWAMVAAAVVLDGVARPVEGGSPGQYA
jgi:hypothetical protein